MKKNYLNFFMCLLFMVSISETISAQYDLTFTVDTGIRMPNGEIPEIGHDTINHLYYLFYTLNQVGNMVATSANGLTFGAGSLQGSDYQFYPLKTLLPNGQWRNYMYNMGLQQMESAISNDGITFNNESGIRYVPVGNDNNSLGVYDVYKMPDNSLTMLYIGDLSGLNNTRKAISIDSGYTFTRVETNVLGDSGVVLTNPGSSYVDITTLSLGSNKRRLICMRGGYGIYSFTSTDYGDNYNFDTLLFTKAQASSIIGFSLLGMYDPAIVLLDDGRYRIYFCANYLVNSVMTYGVFSATSNFPNTVGININNSASTITIYPNPSNGKFKIETNSNKVLSVEIYNALGEKIFEPFYLQNQISNEIDLSKFQKGIYFVKIYDSKQIHFKKIVIQ